MGELKARETAMLEAHTAELTRHPHKKKYPRAQADANGCLDRMRDVAQEEEQKHSAELNRSMPSCVGNGVVATMPIVLFDRQLPVSYHSVTRQSLRHLPVSYSSVTRQLPVSYLSVTRQLLRHLPVIAHMTLHRICPALHLAECV